MEPWKGVLEWVVEWNGVRFRVFVTLPEQDFDFTTDSEGVEWAEFAENQ